MTVLYYARVCERLNDDLFQSYLDLVPYGMRCQVQKYRRWEDGHAYLFGKLLLKQMLSDFTVGFSLDEIRYSTFDRPYFISSDFDFNISHSGRYVICCGSDTGRLGIDLEEMKPIEINDFQFQFTTEEWNELCDSDDALSEFYSIWVRKEAIIKADGRGLHVPLKSIDTSKGRTIVHLDEKNWHLRNLLFDPFYRCAIASSSVIHDPVEMRSIDFYGA